MVYTVHKKKCITFVACNLQNAQDNVTKRSPWHTEGCSATPKLPDVIHGLKTVTYVGANLIPTAGTSSHASSTAQDCKYILILYRTMPTFNNPRKKKPFENSVGK